MKKFPSNSAKELITNVYASFVEPELTYDIQTLQLAQALFDSEGEDDTEENAEEDSTTQAIDAEDEQAQEEQDEETEEIDFEILSEGGSPASGEALSGGGNTVVDNLHDPDSALVLDEPRDLDINWNSFTLELYVPPLLQVDEAVEVQACDVTIIIKFCCEPIYSWSEGKESFSSCGVSSCCSSVFSNGIHMLSQWEGKGGDYSFFEECCFAEPGDDYGGGYGGYGGYYLAEESDYEQDYEDCSDCIEIELNFQDLTTGTFGRFASGDGPCCFDLGVMVIAAALERAAFVVPEDTPSSNYQNEDIEATSPEFGYGYDSGYGQQGISVYLSVEVCITCFDSITVQGLSGQSYSTLGVSFAMSVSCDPNFGSNGRFDGGPTEGITVNNGYGNDSCCFLDEFSFTEFFNSVLSDCCYGDSSWQPFPGPAIVANNYGSGYSSYSDGKNTSVNLDLHICCSEGYSVGSEGNSIDYVNASTFWVSACINCTESEYGHMQIFDDNILNVLFEDDFSSGGYNDSSDCIECCIDCNWITDWLSSVTELQSSTNDNTSLATGFASELGVAQCLAFDKVAALLEGLLAACCCESEDDYQGDCYQDAPTEFAGWGYGDYGSGYELENHSESSQSVALSMGAENLEIYDQVGTTVFMGEEIETYDFRLSESYATLDLVLCIQCDSNEYEIFNPYLDVDDVVATQEVKLDDDEWSNEKSCADECCFDCNWISDLFYDMSEYGLDGNYGQPLGVGFNAAGLFLGKAVENCCCYDGVYEGGYIETPARKDGFGSYESNDNNTLKMAIEFETGSREKVEVDDGINYLDSYLSIETDLEIALCIECDSYEYGHYGQRPFIVTFDDNAYDNTEFDRLHVQGAMLRASLYISQSTDIDSEVSEYIAETNDGKMDYYTSVSVSSSQDLDINLELSIKNQLTIKEGEEYYGGGYLSERASESNYIEETEEECFDCDFSSINCSLELIDAFAVLGESTESVGCICVPEIIVPECNASIANFSGPNDFQLTSHDKLNFILQLDSTEFTDTQINEEYREDGQLVIINQTIDSDVIDAFEISLCTECVTDEIYDSGSLIVPGFSRVNEEYADQFANYNYPKGCCFDCDWTADFAEALAQADASQENLAFEVIANVLGDALSCCCESFEESGFNIEVYNQGPYYNRAQANENQLSLDINSTSILNTYDTLNTSIYEDTYGKKGSFLEDITEIQTDNQFEGLNISLDLRCFSTHNESFQPSIIFPSFSEDIPSDSFSKVQESLNGIELSLDIEHDSAESQSEQIFIPNTDIYDSSPTSAFTSITSAENISLDIDLCICCESEDLWVVGNAPIILDVMNEPTVSNVIEESNGKKGSKNDNDCCFTCELADNLSILLSKENLSNSNNYIQLGVIMVALVADTAVACICEDDTDSNGETEPLVYGLVDYNHQSSKSDLIEVDVEFDHTDASTISITNMVNEQQDIDEVVESSTLVIDQSLDLELQAINTERKIEDFNVNNEIIISELESANLEAAEYEGVSDFVRTLEETSTKSLSFNMVFNYNENFSEFHEDNDYTEAFAFGTNTINLVNIDIALLDEHTELERLNLADTNFNDTVQPSFVALPVLYSGFDFEDKDCIDCDIISDIFEDVSVPTTEEALLNPIVVDSDLSQNFQDLQIDSLCCTFSDSQAALVSLGDGVIGSYDLANHNRQNFAIEVSSNHSFNGSQNSTVTHNNMMVPDEVPDEGTTTTSEETTADSGVLGTIDLRQNQQAIGSLGEDDRFSHSALNENTYKTYSLIFDGNSGNFLMTETDDSLAELTESKTFNLQTNELAINADSHHTTDHYIGDYLPESQFQFEGFENCCAFDLFMSDVNNQFDNLSEFLDDDLFERFNFLAFGASEFLNGNGCFQCDEVYAGFTENGLRAFFNTDGEEHYRTERHERIELMEVDVNADIQKDENSVQETNETLPGDLERFTTTTNDNAQAIELSVLLLDSECHQKTEVTYGAGDEVIDQIAANELTADSYNDDACCINCVYIEQTLQEFDELEISLVDPCFAFDLASQLYIDVLDTVCHECSVPSNELSRGYQPGNTFDYYHIKDNSFELGFAYAGVTSSLSNQLEELMVTSGDITQTISSESDISESTNAGGFGIKICVNKFGEQVVSLEYDSPDFYDTYDSGLVTTQITEDDCCDALEDCVELSEQIPQFTISDIDEGFLNQELSEILADCGCIQVFEIDGSSGGEDVTWVIDQESTDPLEIPPGFAISDSNLLVESFYDQQMPISAAIVVNQGGVQGSAFSGATVGYSICVICEDALYEPEEDENEEIEVLTFASAALIGDGEEQICCPEEFDFISYSTQITEFVQGCCEEHVLSVGAWTNDTYGDLAYENHSANHVATNVTITRGNETNATLQEEIDVVDDTLQTLEVSNDLTMTIDLSMTSHHSENGYISYMGEDLNGVTTAANGTSYFTLSDYGLGDFVLTSPDMSILDGAFTTQIEEICNCCTDEVLFDPNHDEGNLIAQSRSQLGALVVGASNAGADGTLTNDLTGYQRSFSVMHDLTFSASLLVCTECFVSDQWSFNETPESPEDFAVANYPSCCPNIDLGLFEEIIIQTVNTANIENYFLPPDIPYIGENDFTEDGTVYENGYAVNGEFWSHTLLDLQMEIEIVLNDDGTVAFSIDEGDEVLLDSQSLTLEAYEGLNRTFDVNQKYALEFDLQLEKNSHYSFSESQEAVETHEVALADSNNVDLELISGDTIDFLNAEDTNMNLTLELEDVLTNITIINDDLVAEMIDPPNTTNNTVTFQNYAQFFENGAPTASELQTTLENQNINIEFSV